MNWNKAFFMFVSISTCFAAMMASGMIGYHTIRTEDFIQRMQAIMKFLKTNDVIAHSLSAFCFALLVSLWMIPNQKAMDRFLSEGPLSLLIILKTSKWKMLNFIGRAIAPFVEIDVFIKRKIQSSLSNDQFIFVGEKSKFWWYSIISTYISIGFLVLLSTRYFDVNENVAALFVSIQILVVIVVASFLASGIAMIALFSKQLTKKCEYEIVDMLKNEMRRSVSLCEELVESVEIGAKHRLIASLKTCSGLIDDLNDVFDEVSLSAGAETYCRFENFDKYLLWIISPQKTTFVDIKNELTSKSEILHSGFYHSFPKAVCVPKKSSMSQRFKNALMLIGFVLPIIFALIMLKLNVFRIDNSLNGLFIAAYILWCLICANLFADKFSLNVVEIIKDVSNIVKSR